MKKAKKNNALCDLCGLCDALRFRSWRDRIASGLPVSMLDDDPRMKLVQEIHRDRAGRYPLGIAIRLSWVIEKLAYPDGDGLKHVRAADEEAIEELDNLDWDELESVRLNGTDECCPRSIAETVGIRKKHDTEAADVNVR